MSGTAGAVIGIGLGLALILGYAISLLARYRAATARGPKSRGAAMPKRRGRLGKRGRAAALVAFVLVATIAILGLVEGGLRLAGYGGYPPTFVPYGSAGDGRTLVMTDHPGPSSYFFANRSRPASLDRSALLSPKPPDTFRVMVVGGSAAKGLPYPRHLAASAFLEAMLADLMPDVRVEVINLGTTAIASYPVLGLMTESLAYEPDLVVVYCGNNEFYGAYGVASLHSAGRSSASIRFNRAARSLAISQFIESKRPGYDHTDTRMLMEAMVGVGSIGPDDPMRADAARNLESFVGDMVDRCEAAGVPVIVCTPPGNERGLAPLGETDLSDLDEAARAAIAASIEAAEGLLETDAAAAEAELRSVLETSPDHARAHWLLGRALERQAGHDAAAEAYRRALDLDPMPWRAPTASVEAIRRAAAARGAPVCDLVEVFRGASPGGSIGWELMDDHVHPSLAGQALIARAVVETMPEAIPALAFGAEEISGLASPDAYIARLGATEYDAYAAAHAMRLLGMIPFFQQTNPQYHARFDGICDLIEASAPPHVVEQLRAWQSAPTDGVLRRPITGMVATALFDRGEYGPAAPLFESAWRAVEPYGTWELQYAYFMLTCRGAATGALTDADRRIAEEMIDRGVFLVENGYSTTGAAERFVGELLVMLGRFEESLVWLGRAKAKLPREGQVAVDGALVRAYGSLGRRDQAEAIIREGLEGGEPYARYYLQMRALLP